MQNKYLTNKIEIYIFIRMFLNIILSTDVSYCIKKTLFIYLMHEYWLSETFKRKKSHGGQTGFK